MAVTPGFYIKNPKKDKSIIYMGIRLVDGSVFKYYLKAKVIPELFDKGSQRAITDSKTLKPYKAIDPNILVEQRQINAEIQSIENDVNRLYGELLTQYKVVTKEGLRERLNSIYKPKAEVKKNDLLLPHLDLFIKRIESGEKLHKGKRYTKGTIKTYKTFRNVIADFNSKLKFEEVDMSFYRTFTTYLNARGYKINSVGKNIKFVKVIMRDALEAGLHNNMVFTHKDFEVVSEKTNEVYLTLAELDRIFQLDLTNKPNYELVRDVFLCGCYTALRYSDYSRIKPDMVKVKHDRHVLDMITQKTNTRVIIPLKPLVVDILKKYDFELPNTHEQKVNQYIKKVCKMAGITEMIERSAVIGGERVVNHTPKYELVKTHTARRTGATLLYLADVPPIDIMKITGHTKEANLLKYIRISREQTADRLMSNPFFS